MINPSHTGFRRIAKIKQEMIERAPRLLVAGSYEPGAKKISSVAAIAGWEVAGFTRTHKDTLSELQRLRNEIDLLVVDETLPDTSLTLLFHIIRQKELVVPIFHLIVYLGEAEMVPIEEKLAVRPSAPILAVLNKLNVAEFIHSLRVLKENLFLSRKASS
jgi:hypothetical protein